MIKNNPSITELSYQITVDALAESRNISTEAAKKVLSEMSFSEYLSILETVIPPSGQTISPATALAPKTSANNPDPKPPGPKAPSWSGGNTPLTVGMSVGVKDDTGNQVKKTISMIDNTANGVKVKDLTTGKEEWANIDSLEPEFSEDVDDTIDSADSDLERLRELAGLTENSSAGATGAGAIAIAPTALGQTQKRTLATETPKKEYKRKEAPKTVVGDTKPWQASGELSATLAANGKKTASRTNNGFKK